MSYWKRQKTASSELLNALVAVATRASNSETKEVLLNAYVTMSTKQTPPSALIDMVLQLCRSIVDQSKGDDAAAKPDTTTANEEWPEFDLCGPEVDPEDGALENLFENDSFQESAPKRMRTVKGMIAYLAESRASFNLIQMSELVEITRVLEELDDSLIGWVSVQSQCMQLLFILTPRLQPTEFLSLIGATDKMVDFNRAVDLGLLSRFMYHSLATKTTDWIEPFVIDQIRLMANAEVERIGAYIDQFVIILIIMIDHGFNGQFESAVSSLFLNLCSATTQSSQLMLKLLALFGYFLSARGDNDPNEVFVKLEQFLPTACGQFPSAPHKFHSPLTNRPMRQCVPL